MAITADQRRALRMLADVEHSCTLAIMLTHGFKSVMLNGLVRDGLATATARTVRAGTQRVTVVWLTITDAGRQALGLRGFIE
jgi:hypothetical protein